jgi:hypothetical protein
MRTPTKISIQQLNIFKITNLEIFDEHRNVLSSKPSHTSSCKSAYHGTLNSKSSFLQKLGENVNLSKQYSRDYAYKLSGAVALVCCLTFKSPPLHKLINT